MNKRLMIAIFLMPAFLLSGFAFPIRNMPVVVQFLTYLNPLRYYIEIIRGISLKGIGITTLWPQMFSLLTLGLLVLGLSVVLSINVSINYNFNIICLFTVIKFIITLCYKILTYHKMTDKLYSMRLRFLWFS